MRQQICKLRKTPIHHLDSVLLAHYQIYQNLPKNSPVHMDPRWTQKISVRCGELPCCNSMEEVDELCQQGVNALFIEVVVIWWHGWAALRIATLEDETDS